MISLKMSFTRVSAVALLVLAVAVFNSSQGQKIGSSCMGCFEKISTDDVHLKKTLNMALTTTNAGNYKVLKIVEAKRQVVAGYNYRVEFVAEVPGKGKLKCKIAYWDRILRRPGMSVRVKSMKCK